MLMVTAVYMSTGCATALVVDQGAPELLPAAVAADITIARGVAEGIQMEVEEYQRRNAPPEYLVKQQCESHMSRVCTARTGCHCADSPLTSASL